MPSFGEVDTAGEVYRHDDQQISQPALPRRPWDDERSRVETPRVGGLIDAAAEGYPMGELKHGPLALVEPGVTVICLATQTALYDKMLSNVKEVKAREGIAVAVVKDNDAGLDERSVDAVLSTPATEHDMLMPLLSVVPLQLLAYYIASKLDREIDQPRNLAKSVTVE